MVEIMTNKDRISLSRALGLIDGCLHIKEMKDFDKNGLIANLEEIKKILTEISAQNVKT